MTKKFEKDSSASDWPPKGGQRGSYLVNETFQMEQEQRAKEQQGHSRLAKVNVVEHQEPRQGAAALEGELQNQIKQHPYLDSQLNDGADPNENREPDLNSEARMEYDNAKREQALEHTMKLGLMPKGTAPEPKP